MSHQKTLNWQKLSLSKRQNFDLAVNCCQIPSLSQVEISVDATINACADALDCWQRWHSGIALPPKCLGKNN